jgi:hypothetical protein
MYVTYNHLSKVMRDLSQWVFGLADTSSKPAITYMETVDKGDAATLLPIIQRVLKPGTIIHSDQWKAHTTCCKTRDNHPFKSVESVP